MFGTEADERIHLEIDAADIAGGGPVGQRLRDERLARHVGVGEHAFERFQRLRPVVPDQPVAADAVQMEIMHVRLARRDRRTPDRVHVRIAALERAMLGRRPELRVEAHRGDPGAALRGEAGIAQRAFGQADRGERRPQTDGGRAGCSNQRGSSSRTSAIDSPARTFSVPSLQKSKRSAPISVL